MDEIITLDINLILIAISIILPLVSPMFMILIFVGGFAALMFWLWNISDAWKHRDNEKDRGFFIGMLIPFIAIIVAISYYIDNNRARMIKEKKCKIFWRRVCHS